jgi:type II secretory pathway pseudopilin PulG
MRIIKIKTGNKFKNSLTQSAGFTLIEVIIATTLLIILLTGILSVFSYVNKINRGENLRAQAFSVLQNEIEYYRSLKFVPIGTSAELYAGDYQNPRTRTSADNKVFNISVKIDNDPYTAGLQTSAAVPEATCKFKEITITATPQTAETGWLANLKTDITIQRVRSN